MKPIHKLNNGRGATLCHTCSVIISTGLTKDLYCEKCKQETLEQIDQNNPITKGSTALVYKQETLEEAAEKYFKKVSPNVCFYDAAKFGANWQQERSYSEEEVYDLMDKRETFWVRYKNTYSQNYISLKEWFEQFKKK